MSEETETKKPRRKKEPKEPKIEHKKEAKETKKDKVKKKFRFIPLTRDELLSQTSFTITWD